MATFEEIKKEFALDTKIKGKQLNEYLAEQMERNDRMEIKLEYAKTDIAYTKQLNNYFRLLLDSSKHELKRREFNSKQAQNTQNV